MGRDNEGVDWIVSRVQIGFDEYNIVYFSVPVVSLAVLIRRYQFFIDIIEVSNMVEWVVPKYGLYRSVSA